MSEKRSTSPKLVRDLMTVGVATCAPGTPIVDLARLMLEKSLEAVVVLEQGNALGVVNQADLVRAFSHQDFESLSAYQVMREGVPQIPPDIPLEVAAQLMLDQGLRTLYLMHHASGIEYPAAYISYHHILRYISAQNDMDLRDLGIYAQRQSPLQEFFQRRDAARRQVGAQNE